MDAKFNQKFLLLPPDALFEVFSYLEPNTIQTILKRDRDVLSERYNIEEYYCPKHGNRMKLKESKKDVLQKIEDDGLDPNVFSQKLIERTDSFDAEDGDSIDPDLPFEREGEVCKKYLDMMTECHECEQKACDVEQAKRGRLRCHDCNEYERWGDFSNGCDGKCSTNKPKNICVDCEWVCDFCSKTYCSSCAWTDNEDSQRCEECLKFCCGLDGCQEKNGNQFIVLFCESCNSNSCLDCEPFIRCCHVCATSYCDRCRDMSLCEACGCFFCYDCRDVGLCDNCDATFCVECKMTKFCSSCDLNTCDDCSEPFIRFCDVCVEPYCEECRKMSFCIDCNCFFCHECRDVGFCDDCDEPFCVECNMTFYYEECDEHTCERCHHNECNMQHSEVSGLLA